MSSAKQLTPLAQHFLQPSNATHRQYEALRAYFVEGLPGPEVAEPTSLSRYRLEGLGVAAAVLLGGVAAHMVE